MHFYCQCGNRIDDTTDMISYKARMIADQDWDGFLDAICAAIESKEMDREKVAHGKVVCMRFGMMRSLSG